MASTTAMCTSFKKELLEAKHNFLLSGGDSQKIALYTSSATHGAGTTVYSATNELAASGNYVTAGEALTRIDPSIDGTSGITDFADVQWTSATFTAASALIYKVTAGLGISVHDFGGDKTASGGNFDIAMPAAGAGTAILELA